MKIFIDKEGFKYGFEIIKEGIIQPDWVECIPKEDGTFYDDYNLDDGDELLITKTTNKNKNRKIPI